MTAVVMSSSGVIVSPSDVPVGQLQPRTAVVSCTDAGSMVTPLVVPPPPDIEPPCKQLQYFQDMPDVGVTPAFFVVQFISLFRAYAGAETGNVFVVFAFARLLPTSSRERIAPGRRGHVATASR